MTARPRRKHPDPILGPSDVEADYLVSHALLPFDQRGREMDRKWGADRLPALVPPEMAQRWASRMHALDAAIRGNDPKAVAAEVALCLRGFAAMDATAEAAGAEKATPNCIVHEVDGFTFGILRDERMWHAAQDAFPDVRFYTLREVGLALQLLDATGVGAVKQAFPGAEVVSMPKPPPRSKLAKELDDDIPF